MFGATFYKIKSCPILLKLINRWNFDTFFLPRPYFTELVTMLNLPTINYATNVVLSMLIQKPVKKILTTNH